MKRKRKLRIGRILTADGVDVKRLPSVRMFPVRQFAEEVIKKGADLPEHARGAK